MPYKIFTKLILSNLSNNYITGSGRLNRLLEIGHRSTLQGRILAVVSASNLPAQDDLPIMFVNIKNLEGVPIDEFRKAGLSIHYFERF